MDNSTLAKMYSMAVDDYDTSKMWEYGKKILAIDGFDCGGVNALTVKIDFLDYYADEIKQLSQKKPTKDCKAFMQSGMYDWLDKSLTNAEKEYALYVDHESRNDLDRILGGCYETVLKCFKNNDLGKQKAAELVKRALNSGVGKYHLRGLLSYKFLDEQARAEITADTDRVKAEIARQKAEKDNAHAIQSLQSVQVLDEDEFQSFEVAVVTAAQMCKGAAIIKTDNTEDFCIEMFKQHLQKIRHNYDEEAIATLTSENVKVETELFYSPVGLLQFTMQPGHYKYDYSDSYKKINGSFDYGAGTAADAVNLTNTAAKYIVGPSLDLPDHENMKEGKYLKAELNSTYSMPSSLSYTINDAKNAIGKEIGLSGWMLDVREVTTCKCSYSLEAMYYVPIYSIKLTSGKYTAKGMINALETNRALTSVVAAVEDGRFISMEKKPEPAAQDKKTKTKSSHSRLKGARIASGLLTLASIVLLLLMELNVISIAFNLSLILTPAAVILFIIGQVTSRKKSKLAMAAYILSIICGIALAAYCVPAFFI